MHTAAPRFGIIDGMATRGVFVAWLFLSISACGRPSEPRAHEGSVANAPSEAPRRAANHPSFRADVVPVLQANCAGAHGCHGDEPTDQVELDLRADNAYLDLVGRPAKRRPGALRVKPGDPNASFLVDKLLAHLGEGEGKAMPLEARTGETIAMTPPAREFVDTVLRPWIAAGAPQD